MFRIITLVSCTLFVSPFSIEGKQVPGSGVIRPVSRCIAILLVVVGKIGAVTESCLMGFEVGIDEAAVVDSGDDGDECCERFWLLLAC